MATITLQGNTIHTNGEMPAKGTKAPEFVLVKKDLSEVSLSSLTGKKVILNIFPSIDTSVCATSVRQFNQRAANLPNTVVLCISQDLPFAHVRFCGAEGIDKVESVSTFRSKEFLDSYGLKIIDGPLAGLLARAVIVLNEKGEVIYTELVPEIAQEPNYEMALKAID